LERLGATYTSGDDRFHVRAQAPIALSLRHDVLNLDALRLEVEREARDGEDGAEGSAEGAPPALARSQIAATGTLGLGGDAGPDLDVRAAGDVDLALVSPFLASVFPRLDGRGAFSVDLTGPLDRPQIRGEVQLDEAALVPRSSVVGGLLELVEPVVFTLEPLTDDAPIGLCPGSTALEAAALPAFSFALSLAAERRAGDRMVPNRFRLLRDEAPINVDRARVEFRGGVPDFITVRTDVTEMAVNIPHYIRATINAPALEVTLCQHPLPRRPLETRLIVGGPVKILRGEYVADITSASEINQGVRDNLVGSARARQVNVFERVPLLQRLFLDLSVTGDGDFYVRNQITVLTTDLEMRLELPKIRGFLYSRPTDSPEDALQITGQVSVLPDSKLTYARRPFEVTRGTVDFGGVDFLDADVEATHTFRIRTDGATSGSTFDQLTTDVRLEEVVLQARYRLPTRGAPPEITLNLSSNSGLSKIEIATLVLTGSLPDQLTGAASAQPATEVVLQPLLGLVERPLEDTLDIDLSLSTGSTGSLFIEADKLLSRRLRLVTSTLVGDADDTQVPQFRLEYRINNEATAELTNEQDANLNSTNGRLRLQFDQD
ncbi:MAG: translocation/assembly module TamB domain-containing protein, partial [Myxococcales bacterium]|nr:translocation/assembly module TamB domain-containing protein [Myxococcales bacterium]